MPADYIPRSDGEFRVWLEDWLTGARRHGPRLRVMPEQLQRAADATRAYVEALDAHKLAQSCARSARENKDEARRNCEAIVREVTGILQSYGLSEAQRAGMGVRVPSRARSGAVLREGFNPPPPRVRVDASRPMEHVIRFTSSEKGFRRARPRGAEGCEIWIALTQRPEEKPGKFTYLTRTRITPFRHQFEPGAAHKIVWYRFRWADGYGRTSSWSDELRTTVVV